MKKSLIAMGLLAVFGVAQAVPSLDVSGGSWVSFTNYGTTGPALQTGTLVGGYTGQMSLVDGPGVVTFTYLGSNAGDKNRFTFDVAGYFLSKGAAVSSVGDSLSLRLNSGVLDFNFKDTYRANPAAANGSDFSRFAFTEVTSGPGFGTYDYFVSFNDYGSKDHDFNDLVVGVSVSPIPEPETYALMLAGLGVVGFMARRRKQA